jgi:starch synthase
MIAMRYGTVPIVRETGGLKDSVINFDKYNVPEGNGFSFSNFNAHELLFTIKRALTYFEEKPLWEKIGNNAMHSDNSWSRSAKAYADLYTKIAGETIIVEPVSEEQIEKTTEDILQAVKGEEVVEETQPAVATMAETKKAEIAEEAVDETTQTVKEEVVAEAVQETEQEPAPLALAEENKETSVSEPEAEAEPVKKKTAAKRTTKKAADKTTAAKKAESKKTTTRKTTTRKSAAVSEEGTEVKKTSAKKTTARKKVEKTADVTSEAVEAAVPKKRGRKPGSKNKTQEAE